MNLKKFWAALTLAAFIFVGAEAAPRGQMPASELLRLDEAPKGEIARPLPQLTPENSGLNPGYTVTPMQNTRPVAPDDALPNVTATAAIVIEASTGHILYERNPDLTMQPASVTKMMTLIMALEHGGLDEIVTSVKKFRSEICSTQ